MAMPVSLPMPHVAGVEHRFVDVRGAHFHVAEAGDGPPLVLLHGWPQHWWSWREVIAPLSER
jgi:pimeloyl-ACP methyl ester carboxylesterase